MKEFEILTINTPVVRATMKNQGIALVKGMPDVYHKEFDITEFIGEKLAGIRNVRSAHYIPICFGEYKKCLADAKYGNDGGNIRVGSPNFKQEGTKYVFVFDIPSYYMGKGLKDLAEQCPTEENKTALINEHFEMEALDTYMGQKDRRANIYYEYHPNGEIHLSRMFDYENSMFEELKDEIYYLNDFHEYHTIDDYRRMIDKYPQFGRFLGSYVGIDLVEQIKLMAQERGFDLSSFDMEPYKIFNESTQKKLELILK